MGWTNFIIIPKLKLIVETSRYLDEDKADRFSESLEKLINKVEDFNFEILETKYSDLSVNDLSKIVNLASSCWFLDELNLDILLLAWLKKENIDFNIVSEFDFEEKDYKGYLIIRISYGEEKKIERL